jgi:hypothetical protein
MRFILLVFFFFHFTLSLAQNAYYFPGVGNFNSQIPTPEQFFGYPIGSHHTRHDKMVEYFRELDRLSDRVSFAIIGQTYEYRPVVMLTITAPENHQKLEEIRQNHLKRATQNVGSDVPFVIQLGYNVHGNEPSGMEAAILTAYYLTASETAETQQWLKDMVIHLDPCRNPDGRERHTNWANMHKANALVADPLDREHNEVWPGGRTNHYWFDLNRDWFLGIHPESEARLKFHHLWHPYVVTDHHEMGTNSTFYFDPGKNSSNNPIVPAELYDKVYPKFSEFFAKSLNQIQSLYFTKEVFDKLYPGYGSDYVNFYGGIGFLFEQASSRGHIQETSTIPLTFGFTVRNQITTALATVRGSYAERNTLIQYRQNFYKTIASQAQGSPIKAYVFGDENDENRTKAFVNVLLKHNLECYEVENTISANNKTFSKDKAYVVPTDQPGYLMVKSFFEKSIPFADSIFYDASAWSVVHAFNLPYAELKGGFTKGKKITEPLAKNPLALEKSNYAYLIQLTDYQVYKAINQLQAGGAIVQTSFKPFSLKIKNQEKKFGYGTLIVPVQQQKLNADSLFKLLGKVRQNAQIDIFSYEGGMSQSGIDIGSNYVRTLVKPKILMPVGFGVSAYEAGEVWHLLDQRIDLPISKVELSYFNRLNLSQYNTIVMVSGFYNLDKTQVDKLKQWIQNGGTLITFKTASEWAIRQGLSKEKLVPTDTVKSKNRIDYNDAIPTEGAKAIGGAIFEMDLDITHPLGFGFSDRKVSVYKNGKTFLQNSSSPYNTVAQYTKNPLIGGYISKDNLKKLGQTAAVLVSAEGAGRIVMFADNPNFRAFWYGTNKLFLNALFLGQNITMPSVDFSAEE